MIKSNAIFEGEHLTLERHPFSKETPTAKKTASSLKRNFSIWRAGLAWFCAAFAASLLGWLLVQAHLAKQKQLYEESALRNATKAAQNYSGHLHQVFSTIDQLMLLVRYGWETSGRSLRLDDMSKAGLFISGEDFYLGIFDNSGNLLTNTFPGSKKVNLRTRKLFVAQKDLKQDKLIIGDPGSGVFTGRNVIRLSRRILNQHGSFDSIVLASITTAYVTGNQEALTFTPEDFIGVSGPGNIVLATRIRSTVYAPGNQGLKKQPIFSPKTGVSFWDGKEWFDDGRSRYVAWVSLTTYPLVAMVGLDAQQAMAPFWRHRNDVIRNSILAASALAWVTIMAMVYSVRLAYRKEQLERTQATYRVATESAAEAFFIGHVVLDDAGNIIDLQLDDCNRRGEEYLRAPRSDIIGTRISTFFENYDISQFLPLLQDAVQQGTAEAELKLPPNSPLHMAWVHVKLVRQGEELAINLRDISSAKAHVQELERRSNEDALTGLPNRQWITFYLPEAIQRAHTAGSKLGVMFIDLDRFKAVNDTMGHAAGDSILRNAAKRLKSAVRPGDLVGRMGGDEIIVLVEKVHAADDVAQVAERILAAFFQPFHHEQQVNTIGTSIGISIYPDNGVDVDSLWKQADMAMYLVKSSGKRNYRFFDPRNH